MNAAPERLDAFMARANAAYYARQNPYADFTTAPEISQVFGELLGLWAAVCWRAMGRPDPVLLVEAGPGRGTLMADALRAIAATAPDFDAALDLHLIETSPRLRAEQALRLPRAAWHDGLEGVPDGPMLLITNEFLDALPIRQFVRRGAGWTERFVVGGAFVEHAAEGCDCPAGEAEIVEDAPHARAWVAALARRLAAQGGAAVLIDYGPAHSGFGDSLQALRAGRPADPLADPGAADLTAHVDFQALATAARQAGAGCHGPVAQGLLLERLGLFQRSQILARGLPPDKALALMDTAQRLAAPERMGALFKALAITHPALAVPPGFA